MGEGLSFTHNGGFSRTSFERWGQMMGLYRWDVFFCSIVFFVNFFAIVSRGGQVETGFVNGSVGVFTFASSWS
jgi:hypothetical protein